MARDRTKILTNRGQLVVDPSAVGTGGSVLGFSESGLSVFIGDEYIVDPSDDTGAGAATVFYAGGDPILTITLKQWDDAALAAAFPSQYAAANDRIQIPGSLAPGDSMLDSAVILEFRPDSSAHSTVLALKAVFEGHESQPIPMRTQVSKRVTLRFRCLPDDDVEEGDAQYAYRALGIAPAASLSLPA